MCIKTWVAPGHAAPLEELEYTREAKKHPLSPDTQRVNTKKSIFPVVNLIVLLHVGFIIIVNFSEKRSLGNALVKQSNMS